MSLIRRLFLISELHTNYAKMASTADFRSPRSSDQRRFRQASGHHPRTSDQATGYSCNQHRTCVRCTLFRFDKRTLTTERLLSFSHTGKTPDWDMHTQTHSATAVVLNTAPTLGYDACTLQSFQRPTLSSQGLFKASCF